MTRFTHLATLGLGLLGLAACGAAPPPAPASPASSALPRELLNRIVDRYWDEHVAVGRVQSPQAMADSLAVERRYLAEISTLRAASLDSGSRLTYEIFRRQRELAVEGFTYPAELLAADPFEGIPEQFELMAIGLNPAATLQAVDREQWLRLIDDYARWTRQAVVNMREGIRRGYTSPRAVIERSLPTLARLGEDTSANVFYAHLGAALGSDVKAKLLPAYRELHDFLQSEYLPRARTSLALSALPLGGSWYAYRVRAATGTQLTPKEVHGIGTAEIERINALKQAAASAAAAAVAGAPAAGVQLNAVAELKTQSLAAMTNLFSGAPPSDFEIREVESFGAAPRPLIYRPALLSGTSPAVLFVDTRLTSTRSAAQLTANFLREAIPGRHYQSALQQARTDLPRFRRFGTEPAFIEGWGLYAASLGEEMGMYREEAAKTGAIAGQLTCAAALVVDTGLHALGWTRSQAIDYLRTLLALDDAGASLLIDRFVSSPGDGLACKMGERALQALRIRAQQSLGGRFDLRAFHAAILADGAMPLDILEAKMTRWIESQK